jgi:adenylate cyclase
MPTDSPAAFAFEGFVLDLRRGCLREGEREIELRPKSFALLHHLLANAGRLVPKQELIEAIWPDVIVTDDSLARCVSEVRGALGDTDQRIIKTLPRRGYIFAAPVSLAQSKVSAAELAMRPDAPAATPAPVTGTSRRWRFEAGIAGVALAMVGVAAALHHDAPAGLPLPAIPSIAVLPFSNAADGAARDPFDDAVADELIANLSRFSNLFVNARGSSFRYRGPNVDERRVGRELGVRYVLEGSVRRDAGHVRLVVELVDATRGVQLWAEDYDRDESEVGAAQEALAQRIATTLAAHLSQAELERARHGPPRSPAAYDLYLQARTAIARSSAGTREERHAQLDEARRLLGRSMRLDAGYAPSLTSLSQTYMVGWCEPISDEYHRAENLERAVSLARQAVSMDQGSAEAHAQLAWVLHASRRREESLAELRAAMALNPNLADGRLGLVLAYNGRASEAIEFLNRAMRLDPYHDPAYFTFLAIAYFLDGQDDKSLAMQRLASARASDDPWGGDVWFAAAAARAGRMDDAHTAAANILRLRAFDARKFVERQRLANPDERIALVSALGKAGLP